MEMYVNILSPLDETNPHDLRFREFLRGLWQGTPTNLGPTVNSWAGDSTPSISADGLSLYFSSKRSGGWADLWVTTRATVSDPWDLAVKLRPVVSSSYTDDTPSISADGLTLYFGSFRPGPGGHGKMDIWRATRQTTDDEWGAPVNLGPTINSSVLDWSPTISADGLLLVFGSDRPGGSGGEDLWMTRRTTIDDPWSEPVNLGPTINSGRLEASPEISHDGRSLLFSSNRRDGRVGGVDIWQAEVHPVVDLNGDGIVDATDMCIIVDHWGTDNQLCDIGPMPWGDGIVDVQDLIVLAEHLFEEFPPIE